MSRALFALALVGCEAVAQPPRAPSPVHAAQSAPAKPLLVIAETPHAAPVAAAPESLTTTQIAAAASASVVVITTQTGMGAGFVVGSNVIATCLHVVSGADQIVIQARDGSQHPATAVLAYSRANDVALLSVDELAAPILTLGEISDVHPGDAVTVIGHPEGLESTVSTGVVSAIRAFKAGPILQLTAPISPGSSGGPVLDLHGRVIGVTRSLLPDGQQLNFATPVSALQKLLARESSPLPLAEFAEATAPKTVEPERAAAPSSLPLQATQAPNARPSLPSAVGGFAFGMSVDQAKFACATADNQASARRKWPWYTLLEVDGVRGSCPFLPEALDFVSSADLIFAADHLVRIVLVATTRERARERLVQKYGQPAWCEVDGKVVPWSFAAERRASQCNWLFEDGEVAFGNGKKTPAIVYISGTEDELRTRGY